VLAGLAGCGSGSDVKTVTVTEGSAGTEATPGASTSDSEATAAGQVGDTLVLPDEYKQDGIQKDDRLAITLLGISQGAKPNGNPYTIEQLPAGDKLIRLQMSVKQLGSTESGGFQVSQVSAIDAKGQQYPASEGEIFNSPLVPFQQGILRLAPKEVRQGYVAIPVPGRTEIERIEVTDGGYTPPSIATWTLE